MRFLQGRDPSLAMRIAGRAFLPEGPRFASLDADSGDGDERSGGRSARSASTTAPRHLASLYVDDLADVIRDGIDPRFELSRYGEQLAAERRHASIRSPTRSTRPPTLVDALLDEIARELRRAPPPDWSA